MYPTLDAAMQAAINQTTNNGKWVFVFPLPDNVGGGWTVSSLSSHYVGCLRVSDAGNRIHYLPALL